MKREIEITVYDELMGDKEDGDEHYLPTKPKEFMTWFQEKIDLIPEEFREDAEVWVYDFMPGYDDSALQVNICYKRLETDEEEKAREELEENQN